MFSPVRTRITLSSVESDAPADRVVVTSLTDVSPSWMPCMIAFRDASTSSVRPARSGVRRTKPVEMSRSAFWGASFTASAALASTASRSPSPQAGGASTKTGSLGPSTRLPSRVRMLPEWRWATRTRSATSTRKPRSQGVVVTSKRSVLSTTGRRRGSSTWARTRTTAGLEVEAADGHVLDDRARWQPGGGVAVDRDGDHAAQAERRPTRRSARRRPSTKPSEHFPAMVGRI